MQWVAWCPPGGHVGLLGAWRNDTGSWLGQSPAFLREAGRDRQRTSPEAPSPRPPTRTMGAVSCGLLLIFSGAGWLEGGWDGASQGPEPTVSPPRQDRWCPLEPVGRRTFWQEGNLQGLPAPGEPVDGETWTEKEASVPGCRGCGTKRTWGCREGTVGPSAGQAPCLGPLRIWGLPWMFHGTGPERGSGLGALAGDSHGGPGPRLPI